MTQSPHLNSSGDTELCLHYTDGLTLVSVTSWSPGDGRAASAYYHDVPTSELISWRNTLIDYIAHVRRYERD